MGRVAGDKQVTETLRGIVQRTGPPGRGRLLAAIGQRVALRHMPATIRENRPGWAKPSPYYRAWRSGGQPLVDTGRLVNSWAWRATQNDVHVFTAVRYARQLDKGGTIRPRGRFLLIPQSPPLRMTEARGWPHGRSAIAARYPGSFFLFHGPEGPGIYRKSRIRTASNLRTRTARYQARTLGVERIAAAVRQVRQKGYHFGHWRSEWMPDLLDIAGRFLITGKGVGASATGGNPDKGARGGQLA
jgi:phage gpG-like protein